MRPRRRQQRRQQMAQHIRRERRRLGRFVVFSEMLADLTPVRLFAAESKALPMSKEAQIRALREQDAE